MSLISDDDLLNFTDFPMVHGGPTNSPPAQISVNSPSPERKQHFSADDEASETKVNKTSFLTMEYYQQFFNVDTMMVLERISNSMIPKRAPSNYLRSHISLNPDLYGPFWIQVTLIFSIAISGNIANYLQKAGDGFKWHYNFHLVSYAATCIFVYGTFVPAALWGVLKYTLKPVDEDLESDSASYTPSFLTLMCIYGYSLAVYIPASVLWLVQISIFQWILVFTAAFLSGSVLITVLTPALRNSNVSLFLIIGIIGAHVLLAAGFVLFFFQASPTVEVVKTVVVTIAPAVVKTVVNATQSA
ncbi:YIPF1 family protein [Megaselia abdita]